MRARYLGWLLVGATLAATTAAAQRDQARPIPQIQICGVTYDARDERALATALRSCGLQNVRIAMQSPGRLTIQFDPANMPMIGIGPGRPR
jgi:hypothetical protein